MNPIFTALLEAYPDPKTELTFSNPFELIIAVILSAQCTDARVNQVTPVLFKKYPTPEKLSQAQPADVEKIVHSCGFYRMKAKNIIRTASDIVDKFSGKIPNTLEELVTLAGVGRKTASVVLNQAFELPAIAVDTHVMRVSQRLEWTKAKDPLKIEMDLQKVLPLELWGKINAILVLHGRRVCKARKPECESCAITKYCAFYKKNLTRV